MTRLEEFDTCNTSHITRHTSHVTHHTSHNTLTHHVYRCKRDLGSIQILLRDGHRCKHRPHHGLLDVPEKGECDEASVSDVTAVVTMRTAA
jgi:hypothetical protein